MRLQNTLLVRYIAEHPGITSQDAGNHFKTTSRTILNHIKQANSSMGGFANIDRQPDGGYTLSVEDEAMFDAWLDRAERLSEANISSAQHQRVTYLLNDLLLRPDWVTISTLASILNVSQQSISNDLKTVEQLLKRSNLKLWKRPHYGIKVVGSEMNRRLLLANLAISQTDVLDSKRLPHDWHQLIATVDRCVEETLAEDRFVIRSPSRQNLLMHIAIALIRIQEDCYAPMASSQLSSIKAMPEFKMAAHIVQKIEAETSIKLPDQEIAYIAIHLAGKQEITEQSSEDGNLVISDGIWTVVGEMLEAVWKAFRFDFRSDLELQMNLARHLVPLSVRLTFHLNMDNPLLADIKTRSPLPYAMALETAPILKRHYGSTPSEDETGYLALAFALAIERQRTEAPKKRILIVCATGAGSARLLEHRYRQEFGNALSSITTCDVAHVNDIDFQDIDYVFTTVPIERTLPVPVREVRFFLEAQDISDIKRVLSAQAGECPAIRFFDRRLFFPHQSISSQREVIEFLCTQAKRVYELPDTFTDLVMEREQIVATSFGNSVAMPHPSRMVSTQTFVSVALLDQPIMWGQHPVSAVFLVSIADKESAELASFYDSLSSLMADETAIRALLHDQTWETLATLLDSERIPSSQGGEYHDR